MPSCVGDEPAMHLPGSKMSCPKSSGEERSALERFRDFATGVGRDVLVAVLSAYVDRIVRGDS